MRVDRSNQLPGHRDAVKNHERVSGSQRGHAACGEPRIPPPVARTHGDIVERCSVSLDRDPPFDDEIDSPDARHPDLGTDAESELESNEPDDRLQPGFCLSVGRVDQPAVRRRNHLPQLGQLVDSDHPEVKRAVYAGQPGGVAEATEGLDERVERRDMSAIRGGGRDQTAPMRAGSTYGKTRRISGHVDVQLAIVEHPDSAMPQL